MVIRTLAILNLASDWEHSPALELFAAEAPSKRLDVVVNVALAALHLRIQLKTVTKTVRSPRAFV